MSAASTGHEKPLNKQEQALVDQYVEWLQKEASDLSDEQKQRLLLGAASELVDAATELEATKRPGESVVRMGLIAETLSQLAHGQRDLF
ncbi:MAG: hypothetical protein AAF340_02825 [Pseudomonadota bacterium]